MPLDPSKAIKAGDLVTSFEEIPYIVQPTILITDTSINLTYSNFIEAVNLLIEDGWRIDPPMYSSGYLFALCHNPRYKRKNPAETHED
jgi:hypothetical protein